MVLRSCGVVLVFVLAGCGGCNAKKEAQERAAREARVQAEAQKMMAKATQDRATAPRIHIPDVIKEINADPTAASTRYDGQLVKVTGAIAEKDTVHVIIHDDDGAATCALPQPELAKVTVGDKVDVTGYFEKGSGHVAVRLNACQLLEKDGGG